MNPRIMNLMAVETKSKNRLSEIGGEVPTNGAKEIIEYSEPYVATVTIEGVADILFHRWNCEEVDAKGAAAKGSKAKKTDNLESYVYRLDPENPKSNLAIPGEYLRMAIIGAAKFRQDPRSPRKSAMDLFKAGVVALTQLSDLGTNKWDYEDRRRVVIQRNGVNRTRPAMKIGWQVEFEIQVNLPEYINPAMLNEVIGSAGRLIGIGDFRPTYGRFMVTEFSTK